eukprot:15441694-Alexandrium_andersonii.AAC.1
MSRHSRRCFIRPCAIVETQTRRKTQYGFLVFPNPPEAVAAPHPGAALTQHLRRTRGSSGAGGVSASRGRLRAERSCVSAS